MPLILETAKLDNAKLNVNYSSAVSVCGGTGNYTFTASGLPAGLTMSLSGKISGKPTTSGIYQVKITVSDSAPANRKQTRTHTFTLNVSA